MKRLSLTNLLLKKVFTMYMIVLLSVTAMHFIFEIIYTKKDIINELKIEFSVLQNSLAHAMWTVNDKAVQNILNGSLHSPIITGISVRDSNGEIIVEKFISQKKDFNYNDKLEYLAYEEKNGVGNVTIHSNMDVVYERVKVGWFMLLLNAIIQATLLVFLILFSVNQLVKKPLNEFINTLKNIHLDEVHTSKISINDTDSYELNELKVSFNEMSIRLLDEINSRIEFEKLSITDNLTRLYNRNKLEEVLLNEAQKTQSSSNTFGIILMDIDFFKSINDTYGHLIGDTVLKEMSEVLKSHSRNTDIVGRWGGEEFLIICSETDIEGVQTLANKLREEIASFPFSKCGNKTASFGVSVYKKNEEINELIKRADDALYQAKKAGRDTVCTN